MAMANMTGERVLGWVVAPAALFRLVTLGIYPLTDTTEARYGEIARKMAELGDWATPWFDYGVPFWGKPPLSFWLSAGSFRLFGVNEFAARLPHWLAAVFVSWLVWDWLKRRSAREAILALALLWGAALFYVSAGAVMTDMTLAVGTTLAMRGFWLGVYGDAPQRQRERWLFFLGLSIGLLAKGPMVLVLVGLPIVLWSLVTREVTAWRRLPWLPGGLIVVLLTLPWYVAAELKTPGFLNYFLLGEHWLRFTVTGWSGDRYGNAHAFARGSIWLFAVVASLPWTVLVLLLAYGRGKTGASHTLARPERDWHIYLLLWGLAPCLFFTFAGNILWTYVLPGLPALAILTAVWLAADPRRRRVNIVVAGGVIVTALGMGAVIGTQQTANSWKTAKSVVEAYQARKANDEPLIFIGTRPYSAAFYSQGKAEQVSNMAQLAQRLKNRRGFIALTPQQQQDVPPELQSRLNNAGHYGNYRLFSVKP